MEPRPSNANLIIEKDPASQKHTDALISRANLIRTGSYNAAIDLLLKKMQAKWLTGGKWVDQRP